VPIPKGAISLVEGPSGTLSPTPAEANGWADGPLLSWQIHFCTKRTDHINRRMGIPTDLTWPCVVSTHILIWKYLAHHAQRTYSTTFAFPVWKVSLRSRCH